MSPTVGRIIHVYEQTVDAERTKGAGPFAAVVTDVEEKGFSAYVFPARRPPFAAGGSLFFLPQENNREQVYFWRWPPRE